MVISYNGGGNRSTSEKLLTCRKSLTNFSDHYEQLPFIHRLRLYTLFLNEKMRLPFIDSDYLEVHF
jgi:hypothetical protein